MRFNPDSSLDSSRVDDSGSSGPTGRLPMPSTAGGGKVGLILLLVGLLVRFLASRRSARRV